MAKSRSSRTTTAKELEELRDTVEKLIDHVQCLTNAVDELCDEVGWRNNNTPLTHPLPSRVVVTSTARDPLADDLRVNEVPQDVVEQLRRDVGGTEEAQSTAVATSPTAQTTLFD
ncbi:MAG: hypothetical protein IH991_17645 [Planctomycetes bacterium]|nr:hypothetical protein [Planctomycetota bacterium]